MDNNSDNKAKKADLQEFAPPDLPRIIETASEKGHPTLEDLENMARDSLKELKKLPPGEARDAMMADARMTIAQVRKARSK